MSAAITSLPAGYTTPSYLLALHLTSRPNGYSDWLASCYQLSARVARLAPERVLLDLGTSDEHEARAIANELSQRLAAAGLSSRMGIASSQTLAQLALLCSPSTYSCMLLTPADASAFLRPLSVRVLPHVYLVGRISQEQIARLYHYGLPTLGHVARIGEAALRRQFGAVGGILAALAVGRDAHPFAPTPPDVTYRVRLRFATPIAPEQLLAYLPTLARRIASGLRARQQQARELRLALRWEQGGVQHTHRSLRQPTDDPFPLTQELRRLLAPLLTSPATNVSRQDAVDDLRLTLSGLTFAHPTQSAFWRSSQPPRTTLEGVAETLARRHQRPLLFSLSGVQPDAIFSEERFHWISFGALDADVREPLAHTTRLPAISPTRAAPDRWQNVPRRLHWW